MALRDLLDLPPSVRNNDFVIRLTQEVTREGHALQDYAVTPGILRAYDQALQLVGSALAGQQSMAAYIHGSFGTGKSHFMAILSLLLGDFPAAWEHEAFRELRAKHSFVGRKKILRLHFHMIGASSLEERVLGGYADQIRALHPEAPLPALWEDAGLFSDAEMLRQDMGDEAFFKRLNEHTPRAAEGWGQLAQSAVWSQGTFAVARQSALPEERARLFDALVKGYFSAYAVRTAGYIDIDRGLSVVAVHARSLGYDAIALFLDELVLWLSSRATDVAWLNGEVQKMVKLVESQAQARPIPLISFVARQRDMRQMVGEQFAGVASQNLVDSLRWWEGRLSTINLEDRNLPAIIEKRVVRAKDAPARAQLDGAFAKARQSLNSSGWDMLRGDEGDEKSFRQVYPFSPALVSTLVALSSFLQRERTALKVLVELLVEHMEDFELGKLMPVGDLFDVLAGGEEPMDGVMRERFAAARRLYNHELLPLIRRQNQTESPERCQRLRDDHPISLGCSGCRQARCRADNRLAKTVLLAALVPETPALKGLTVSRLVRLNHGMLPQGPIPGRETPEALARIRAWAGEIGKVRLGDGNDPSVGVMLEGVDLKPILESARGADSEGARRRRVQRILFQSFSIEHGVVLVEHEVQFHGTKRKGSIHFGNVREMTDDQLQAPQGHEYKIVIDYPFDSEGHSPGEDVERINRYLERGLPAPTVVWLPSFFSERLLRDLADLVVLDKLQDGSEEARGYLSHLRTEDANRALMEISNLASQKEARVKAAIDAVYGVNNAQDGTQDEGRSLGEHFYVLTPGLAIRPLGMASNLHDTLTKAIDQLLDQRYPRHPRFKTLVTPARLKTALRRFAEVCQASNHRATPQPSDQTDLDVPRALGLVLVTDAAALLVLDRIQEIEAALRRNGAQVPTVDHVKKAADSSGVFGLTRELSDFLVLAWALATNREVRQGTQVFGESAIGNLPLEAELFLPPMPTHERWEAALKLLHALTGELAVPGRATPAAFVGKSLHPQNLRAVADQIRALRTRIEQNKAHLIDTLLDRRSNLVDPTTPRLETARSAHTLWGLLGSTDAVALIDALGGFVPQTSAAALRKHIDTGIAVTTILGQDLNFQILSGLLGRHDPEARRLLGEVRVALASDEQKVELAATLPPLVSLAHRLLAPPPEPSPPVGLTLPVGPMPGGNGGTAGGGGSPGEGHDAGGFGHHTNNVDGVVTRGGEGDPSPLPVVRLEGRGSSLMELEAAVEKIRRELAQGGELSFQWSIRGHR
jgi:hypothetical protein